MRVRRMKRGHPGIQAGFSLIELMVAVTISSLLLTGLTILVIKTNDSYRELTRASIQMENGRFAIELLKDDIQHAGYYGEFSSFDGHSSPAAFPDPCANALANLWSTAASPLLLPIQAYDDHTGALSTCLSDANHLDDTDILVIRRAETVLADPNNNQANLAADYPNDFFIQTRGYWDTPQALAVLDTGGSGSFTLKKRDGVTPANIRRYHVHIYYIRPCSVSAGTDCTATDPQIPTLYRMVLKGNGQPFLAEPLVEGIEQLQLDYGVDIGPDALANGVEVDSNPNNLDSVPDEYLTGPTLAQWRRLVAVRINLLARNLEPTLGHDDTKTYDLGGYGTIEPPRDSFKRHAYSELVYVRNPADRLRDN